jgi:hypothetical protein
LHVGWNVPSSALVVELLDEHPHVMSDPDMVGGSRRDLEACCGVLAAGVVPPRGLARRVPCCSA